MKKKAFGIVLLILAAWILFQGHYGVPSLETKYSPFIFIAFLLYKAVESFLRHHWTTATFLALSAAWRKISLALYLASSKRRSASCSACLIILFERS